MTQTICAFPECNRGHYGNGLCNAHWQQEKAGKELRPIRRTATNKTCIYDDCGRKTDRRGWCQMHYKQILAGEELRPIRAKISQAGVICFLPHCDKPAYSQSACRRHKHLLSDFDLTYDELIAIFAEIRCGICDATDNSKREFHIDHDHSCCRGCSKCVRGLLCGACNTGLGLFYDSIPRLTSAIAYLERNAA